MAGGRHRATAGYTLIEMSIVVMVLALLATGAVTLMQKKTDADRSRLTQARMEYIDRAIRAYYDVNRFLPCPAAGSIADGAANFGISGANSPAGTPTSSPGYDPLTLDCVQVDAGMGSAGVVPTRTLQIPDEYMYDGWNRRFTYRIASRMGRTLEMEDDATRGDLSVINLDGRDLTQFTQPAPYNYGAAYVLISHGANGTYAWLSTGLRYTSGAVASTMEEENSDHNEASGGDRIYIKDNRTVYYDDLTLFRRKADFKPRRRSVSPYRFQSNVCTDAQMIVSNQNTMVSYNGIGIRNGWQGQMGRDPGTFNDGSPNAGIDTVALEAARSLADLCFNAEPPAENSCIENLYWDNTSGVADCKCTLSASQVMLYGYTNERMGSCGDPSGNPLVVNVPATTCPAVNPVFTGIQVVAGRRLFIEVEANPTMTAWAPRPSDNDGPTSYVWVYGDGENGESFASPTRPVLTHPEGALIYCISTSAATCTGGSWAYAGNEVLVSKENTTNGQLLLAPNVPPASCPNAGATGALNVIISQ